MMRLKSCRRCSKGDQYYDVEDDVWVCLQCGCRVPANLGNKRYMNR